MVHSNALLRRVLALGAVLAFFAPAVHCQQTTQTPNLIQTLASGWGTDAFLLTVDQPVLNPANCPEPDGYAIELSAGYKTHYAAALLAFSLGRKVQITVFSTPGQCVNGRPMIYGVKVLPP